MKINIPRDLIEQIARKNCVVFVGAGPSMGIGLPGWLQLLQRMIKWCESQSISLPNKADIELIIDKKELLLAADALREQMGDDKYREFMDEVFRRPGLKPTDVHFLITRIPFVAAITTNYDKLVESSYTVARQGEAFDVFTQVDHAQLSTVLHDGEFFVLKAHGTIERFETIVLGKNDYRKLIHDSPGYRMFLHTLFSTKTVFFVGFGLADPELLLLLDEMKEAFEGHTVTHYAFTDVIALTQTEQVYFEKNYGIQIIPYTPSAADHPEVESFLTELISQIPEPTVWQALEEAQKIVQAHEDPHYKVVFNTKKEMTIEEKYPGASEAHPLGFSMQLRFDTNTPEGREAHEAWKRHLSTGEPVTITSPHLAGFVLPDIITRFINISPEFMKMTTGAMRGDKQLPVKFIIEGKDRETATVDNIILENVQGGEEQMLLSNERQGGPWKFQQIYRFDANQSNISFTFSDAGLNVKQALDGWRFLKAMSKGGKLLTVSLETGSQIGQAQIPPGACPGPDQRLIELLEALQFIQSKTSILFTSPDRITLQDFRIALNTVQVLQTGSFKSKIIPFVSPSKVVQAQVALDRYEGGRRVNLISYLTDATVIIFGRRVSLGPVLTTCPTYMTPEHLDKLRSDIKASAPDDTINVYISPVEDAPMEGKFPDWLPAEEADRVRKLPFVRLTPLKELIKLVSDTVKTEKGRFDVDDFMNLLVEARSQASDEGVSLNPLSSATAEELRVGFAPIIAELAEEERSQLITKIIEVEWLSPREAQSLFADI